MAYNTTECSHCLNFTTEDLDQLESVEEMYFKTREIEGEDKEDDYSDSNSSSDDEGDADQDDPQDDAIHAGSACALKLQLGAACCVTFCQRLSAVIQFLIKNGGAL